MRHARFQSKERKFKDSRYTLFIYKITFFKTLDISIIVYLGLIICVSSFSYQTAQYSKNKFIWRGKKIKRQYNLQNTSKLDGPKHIDFADITNLQCSLAKQIFNEYFRMWKIIPIHLNQKGFGGNFKF